MTYYEGLRERHVGWYKTPPAGAVLKKRGGEAGLAMASDMGLRAVTRTIKSGMGVNLDFQIMWHEQPDWHNVRHPDQFHGDLYRVMTRGIDAPPVGITAVRAALRDGYDAIFDNEPDITRIFGVDGARVDEYRNALSVVPEDAPIEPDRLWIPDHLKLEEL